MSLSTGGSLVNSCIFTALPVRVESEFSPAAAFPVSGAFAAPDLKPEKGKAHSSFPLESESPRNCPPTVKSTKVSTNLDTKPGTLLHSRSRSSSGPLLGLASGIWPQMRALGYLAIPAFQAARGAPRWRTAASRAPKLRIRSLARFELGSSAMASWDQAGSAGGVEADDSRRKARKQDEAAEENAGKTEDGAAKPGAEGGAVSTAMRKSEAISKSGAEFLLEAVTEAEDGTAEAIASSGAVASNENTEAETMSNTEAEPMLKSEEPESLIGATEAVTKSGAEAAAVNFEASKKKSEAEGISISEAEPTSKSEDEPVAEQDEAEDKEREGAAPMEVEDGEANGATGKKRTREDSSLADASPEKKPLTKSALKKLKRRELLQQKHKETKAQAKEKKKALQEERAKAFAALSTEEKEAAVQRSKESRQQRQEETMKRKEKLKQSMEAEQNLVIDLELCGEMNESEIKSMAQQVMFSYAANGKSNNPVRLTLTGLAGAMKDRVDKIPGSENWYLHKEERPYLDVFSDRKQDIVYLTADSETVVDSFDSSKIYIIGGLVDHNRLKGVTLQKARKQGIQTARLPIQENIKLATSAVLTVNQVVEIFLEFLECKDWKKALRTIIPQRKIVV